MNEEAPRVEATPIAKKKAAKEDALELVRLRPTVSVSLGRARLVEWPSGKHPGAKVSETEKGFIITTADGRYVTKVPHSLAVASYARK